MIHALNNAKEEAAWYKERLLMLKAKADENAKINVDATAIDRAEELYNWYVTQVGIAEVEAEAQREGKVEPVR